MDCMHRLRRQGDMVSCDKCGLKMTHVEYLDRLKSPAKPKTPREKSPAKPKKDEPTAE